MGKFGGGFVELLYDLSMDGSWQQTGDVEYGLHVTLMQVSHLQAQYPVLTNPAYLLFNDELGRVTATEFASEEDAEAAFESIEENEEGY